MTQPKEIPMKQGAALHFPWIEMEKLMEEIRTAKTAQSLYGEETGKGFWLVGDHGVYLMPNTTDGIHHRKLGKNDRRLVAYATECNPDTMEFDDWWDTKRRTFGGDDGVEFLALTEIEAMAQGEHKPNSLKIEFMGKQMAISIA
jgi:hypothetical protein